MELGKTVAQNQGSSNSTVQLQTIQCKHWIRKMKEFKFVAVTLCLLDHDKQSKIFSKAQQGDASLALDYPTCHERFKSTLESAQNGQLGTWVKRNLAALKTGTYAGVRLNGLGEEVAAAMEHSPIDPTLFEVEGICGKRKFGRGHQYLLKWLGFPEKDNTWEGAGRVQRTSPKLVEAFERGDSAADQQAAARSARTAARAAFREPEEAAVTLDALDGERRLEAENAIEARIRRYAAAMAGAMLEKFDERLPMPQVLIHLREMFDFRRMPWGDVGALTKWSDADIKWIVEEKFPDMDVFIVQSEALKVRLWLNENQEKFKISVPVHNADGDIIKGQHKQELALCGEGSIFNELFTRYDALFPSGIKQYLGVADYNIAFMVTQCATERIGRNMTECKPASRCSIADDNFKKIVWISYNCPPIHEKDFSKYVDMWIKEKHQLALFQSGGESKVLERKSKEHKHTLLSNRIDK
jgi:hypothetical protein